MLIMGNAYPSSGHHGQHAKSPAVHNDADWDESADSERVALLEENARLRALVVQLSTLVLKNVVDQPSSPHMFPVRRSRLD
jgi:hypothetical protein